MQDKDRLISKLDLQALADGRGAAFSISQIDRFREHGLILVAKHQALPGAGSRSEYSARMVENLVTIAELQKRYRDLGRVGFELWWAGHDVLDRCWRPIIEQGVTGVWRITEFARGFLMRVDQDDSFGDRALDGRLRTDLLPAPIRKPMINMARGQQRGFAISALLRLTEAVAGFSTNTDDGLPGQGSNEEIDAFATMTGLAAGKGSSVQGQSLDIDAGLREALEAFRELGVVGTKPPSVQPINVAVVQAARDDIRNAMHLIDDLHHTFSWILGGRAFGLKSAAWIAGNASPAIRSRMLAMWPHLQRAKPHWSSETIAELRKAGAWARQEAEKLQSAIESRRDLSAILTKARLKAALHDGVELKKLISEIEQIRPA